MTQGSIWLLTIPQHEFLPYLPTGIRYIKGQLERGAGGFVHWQLIAYFNRSVRLGAVRRIFGAVHCELSRSAAADAYVWKEDTRIEGTQFDLGVKPIRRNNLADWDNVRQLARENRLDEVESSIYIRYYCALKRIAQDNLAPTACERDVTVFWGPTGLGKSRRAWYEAGLDAYPKDPRSKFWDGYRGQNHVVIDEFRGGIDISHVLRWFDRYPVIVEVKGTSTCLKSKHVWITSNLHPKDWYPNLDPDTLRALLRRLTVVHFDALA